MRRLGDAPASRGVGPSDRSRYAAAAAITVGLAVRLVLLFAMGAVLPGVLVYAVSVNFLGKSIESWFDVRVDRALEGGLNVGRVALDSLLKDAGDKARRIGDAIVDSASPEALALTRSAEQTGAYEASLYTATGSVLA